MIKIPDLFTFIGVDDVSPVLDNIKSNIASTKDEVDKLDSSSDKLDKTTGNLVKRMTTLNTRMIAYRLSLTAVIFGIVRYTLEAEKAARASEETQKNLERELYLIQQNENAWAKFKNTVGETVIKVKAANIDFAAENKIRQEAILLLQNEESFRKGSLATREAMIKVIVDEEMAERELRIEKELSQIQDEKNKKAEEERLISANNLIDALQRQKDASIIRNALMKEENELKRGLQEIEIDFIKVKQDFLILAEKEKLTQDEIAKGLDILKQKRENDIDAINRQSEALNELTNIGGRYASTVNPERIFTTNSGQKIDLYGGPKNYGDTSNLGTGRSSGVKSSTGATK